MKKILAVLVILGLILIIKTPITKQENNSPTATPQATIIQPTAKASKPAPKKETKAIFVPEWNLAEETILHNGYDRWIYFGGGEKLALFKSSLPDKNLWITIRAATIEDLEKVKVSSFDLDKVDGIVLDLEVNGLATPEFVSRITGEIERIQKQAKNSGLKFSVAMYGDLFYRKRPYDLKKINEISEEVMVMAYDFHKTYGEPGENYPLEDFKKMVDEYLAVVPAEKLTIIFGMYGYDWTLKDGKPLKTATALSLFDIRSRFMKKVCLENNCKLITNDISKEKKVAYTDDAGLSHEVYFEDEESVEIKKTYLKERGVTSSAFWAWGYF